MEIPDPLMECVQWWVRKLRHNGEDPAQALRDNRELEALGGFREMLSATSQEEMRWLIRTFVEIEIEASQQKESHHEEGAK